MRAGPRAAGEYAFAEHNPFLLDTDSFSKGRELFKRGVLTGEAPGLFRQGGRGRRGRSERSWARAEARLGERKLSTGQQQLFFKLCPGSGRCTLGCCALLLRPAHVWPLGADSGPPPPTGAEAVLALEAECQRSPGNAEAWRLLGTVQAENDDDQQAIAAMNR